MAFCNGSCVPRALQGALERRCCSRWNESSGAGSRRDRIDAAGSRLGHVSAATGPRGERQPERSCPVGDNAAALVGAFVAVEVRIDAYARLGYPLSADRGCVSSTLGARRRPSRARATRLLRGGPALRWRRFPASPEDDEGGLRRKTHATALRRRYTRASGRASSLVGFGSGGGVIVALALVLACDLRQFTSVYRCVGRA